MATPQNWVRHARAALYVTAHALALAASSLTMASEALAGDDKPNKVASNGPDVSAYGDAFSDPVTDMQAGSQGATGKDADDILNALTTQGSFPLRLHIGEDAEMGWPEDTPADRAPPPVARRYKLGGCEFAIRTGEFSVRRYRAETGKAKGQFAVVADALQRNTTIPAESKETLYLSATTELVASSEPSTRIACTKVFSGKRVSLGRATLGRSTLELVGADQSRVGWGTVTEAPSVAVYMTWDTARGEISVEEASGLPPALESAIFEVAPTSKGDFYLALAPVMELSKKK